MTQFSYLKVGDTTHYCSGGRYGRRISLFTGTVTKISPTGQITVERQAPGGVIKSRFEPKHGFEIGGNYRLCSEETAANITARNAIIDGEKIVRDKLRALADVSVSDKQAVLQALREALALAETNLVDTEA